MHNTKIKHKCTSIEQTVGADQIPLGKKLFHRESDVLRPLHELGGEGRSGAAERAVREQVLRREGFPWRKLPRQHCIQRLHSRGGGRRLNARKKTHVNYETHRNICWL